MDCSSPGSLSMGFSRQEYWTGLPCPPPGDLPNLGTEPVSLMSPAWGGGFFPTSTTWKALSVGTGLALNPPCPFLQLEEGRQPWLCGESFTLADVSLAVTLHRLKFLGFARRNWGNGKRPNLETYYERVLKRKTFNKVLGHVNNILISAVLPTAFRVAKKRAPKVLGTTLVVGLLAGMGYFAFMLFRKRLGSMILALRPRPNYF